VVKAEATPADGAGTKGRDDLAATGVCPAWEADRRLAPPRNVLSGNFPHGPERRHLLEPEYVPLLLRLTPGYHPPAHPETGAGLNRGSANAFLQSLPQAIGSHAAAPANAGRPGEVAWRASVERVFWGA
jgi:hypothetical protein